MGIWFSDSTKTITIKQFRLLEAFADLAAIGIEHAQLTESTRDARVHKK
jgi:hypothetical protein